MQSTEKSWVGVGNAEVESTEFKLRKSWVGVGNAEVEFKLKKSWVVL